MGSRRSLSFLSYSSRNRSTTTSTGLNVMGRLKPGVTIKEAQQNMDAVTAHIAQMYPKSNQGWGAYVEPLKNDYMPKDRIKMLWLLLGAVGFVLLITFASTSPICCWLAARDPAEGAGGAQCTRRWTQHHLRPVAYGRFPCSSRSLVEHSRRGRRLCP